MLRSVLLLLAGTVLATAVAAGCGGGKTYWSAEGYGDRPVYGLGEQQGVSKTLHDALGACGLQDEDAGKAVRVFRRESIEGLVISTDVKGLVGFRDLVGTDRVKWFNVKDAGSGVFEVACTGKK